MTFAVEISSEKTLSVESIFFKGFIRIFEKYWLRYFLFVESALESVRHGGIIPCDDDIDVGIPRADHEIFLGITQEEESALFSSMGDNAVGAYQLERLLADTELATRFSRKALKTVLVSNDPKRVVECQLEKYPQVIISGRGDIH